VNRQKLVKPSRGEGERLTRDEFGPGKTKEPEPGPWGDRQKRKKSHGRKRKFNLNRKTLPKGNSAGKRDTNLIVPRVPKAFRKKNPKRILEASLSPAFRMERDSDHFTRQKNAGREKGREKESMAWTVPETGRYWNQTEKKAKHGRDTPFLKVCVLGSQAKTTNEEAGHEGVKTLVRATGFPITIKRKERGSKAKTET